MHRTRDISAYACIKKCVVNQCVNLQASKAEKAFLATDSFTEALCLDAARNSVALNTLVVAGLAWAFKKLKTTVK